jgi:hypothetical protein
MPVSPVTVLISAFNSAVDDFFKDLSAVFPRQGHIERIHDCHCIAARSNVRLPITKFHEHVMVPYGEMLRDFENTQAFFLSHGFGEVHNNTIVDILKDLWGIMTPENKRHVFGHLKLIIGVYDRAVETDPAQFQG